jgi:hypothetical protein
VEIITYSLRNDSGKSDQYYRDIAAFTDEALAEVELAVGGLVERYKGFLLKTDHEVPRSSAEYIFEIIMLGVFWRAYHANTHHLGEATRRTLIHLAHLKSRGGAVEWVAKHLTGVIVTIFLNSSEKGEVKPPALIRTGVLALKGLSPGLSDDGGIPIAPGFYSYIQRGCAITGGDAVIQMHGAVSIDLSEEILKGAASTSQSEGLENLPVHPGTSHPRKHLDMN